MSAQHLFNNHLVLSKACRWQAGHGMLMRTDDRMQAPQSKFLH